MSVPRTTIKIKGTVENAHDKHTLDLEIEIPLRPLAAIAMSIVRAGSCAKSTQGDVDGMVMQMLDD